MFLALYLLLLAALALLAPAPVWDPGARSFVLIVGWIAVWRYGWGGVHLLRSLWYRAHVFPRWRRRILDLAAADPEVERALLAPEVYIVVTSYRIPVPTTEAVLAAALVEAERYRGGRVTIVTSIVEMADQRLIKDLFRLAAPPEHVRLILVRGRGTGKRDGLATALRAVARQAPAPGAVVLVMDGDTVLPPDCLARILPFFRLMPDLAALTTDEDCVVPHGGPLLRAWHQLRFTQRHLLMSSLGLSRRLITLTGRMSAYRAEIATDPAFVALIQHDRLDHWRHGPIPLLTGEDKSAAYWLLRQGRATLYVPDVTVLTIEQPPAPDLLRASTALMLRWFGNMLRASGRCLALGPARVGWFVWWCLVDQRISMWTPLIGPITAILLAFAASPAFLYAYTLWVMLTRLVQSLLLLAVRPRFSGLYPPLLYFTQLYGAFLKSWVLFRLDRQRWTRQNISWAPPLGPWRAGLRALGSSYLHLLALAALTTGVAFATGVLTPPSTSTFAAAAAALR
ncbi:glycosyltransferase [Benzoatithermus flavus]|uniref:Glycosyltransferase n=1 Tax=Benzoatithermus flavus TaxID=3108223 RepID=A0ABU8XX80_9PROT